MPKYAILCNPGHNRVYFDESAKLSAAEFAIASQNLGCGTAEPLTLAGTQYFAFESENPLGERELAAVSGLSFVYAIFELVGEEPLLRPVLLPGCGLIDPKISSMLKYTGKTNEIFTRMMINVALHSSVFSNSEKIRLIDPIAGKGTTLFEGLIRGFDVCGIEIGSKVAGETYHFFKKFLETEKLKHNSSTERFSGANKSFTSTRYSFEFARSREELKSNPQNFELIAGDSRYADKFYTKARFHLIIGDLPYGVQHSNVTGENQSSKTRNPAELLSVCLPAWKNTLLRGGAICLSWNNFLLSRPAMSDILSSNGFCVYDSESYLQFEHRVDQAIRRDIIVATKK